MIKTNDEETCFLALNLDATNNYFLNFLPEGNVQHQLADDKKTEDMKRIEKAMI